MTPHACARLLFACLLFSVVSIAQAPKPRAGRSSAATYDVLIRNGHVYDGAGNPWVDADVAIRGDRIVNIGRDLKGKAKRTIDAQGLAVSPGFFDMHTHSDLSLLVDGTAQSKIRQGVTTEILGEASSVAPVCPAVKAEAAAGDADLHIKRDWNDLNGYFRKLLRQGVSLNVGTYVAGGTVRACAMGYAMREPTPAELEKEKSLVAAAMKQGALGLSTGMIYPPGSYAKTDELVELAKVASQYGGIYTSHIRNESSHLLDAIQETITIAEQGHIPVHILHIKASGKANWGRIKDAVNLIDQARARGLEISADQYPYIASSTTLTTAVPQWAMEGGTAKLVERLHDPAQRARIREAIVQSNADHTKQIVASLRSPGNQQYEGHSIAEIAEMRHEDPADTILNLLSEENGRVLMVFFTMSEDDVQYAMKQPWVSLGSDGTAVRPEGLLGRDKPHPRYYGATARLLGHYVRDEHVLTLEDAIRKMTSLAASQLGVHDRGLLAPGYKADVVVFDPATVADKATFADPHQYAVGVKFVLVNGKVVINDGEHTGARPGQAVYGAGRTIQK